MLLLQMSKSLLPGRQLSLTLKKAGNTNSSNQSLSPKYPLFFKNQRNNSDDYTYNPLYLKVSSQTAKCATAWRYIFLVVFVILLVPHDLYAPASDMFSVRWGFWANKITHHSFPLKKLDISLENCNLYLSPGYTSEMKFEVSRDYSVGVTTTEASLEVKASEKTTVHCDVILTLPTKDTALVPAINIKFNGTLSQLTISDKYFSSSQSFKLQDSAQLNITGNSARLALKNHQIPKLKVTFENVYASLDSIKAPNITVISQAGYLNGIVASSYSQAYLKVTQPYGSICLSAPTASLLTNSSCPTKSQLKSPIQVSSSGHILGDLDCKVEARICAATNTTADGCKTSVGAGPSLQNWAVVMEDGNVHVSFYRPLKQDVDLNPSKNKTKTALSLIELDQELLFRSTQLERKSLLRAAQIVQQGEAVSFVRNFAAFNGLSQKILQKQTADLKSNPGIDVVYKYFVEGWGQSDVWLYTNKRPYLQAKVWLLSFVSLSLLKPQTQLTTLALLDRRCPAEPITLTNEGDISNFLIDILPNTAQSTVAQIKNGSDLYEFIPQSDGSYVAQVITLGDSALIITLLIIGFLLTVFIAAGVLVLLYYITKAFNMDYQAKIQQQRRLAATRKRQSTTQSEKKRMAPLSFVTEKGIMGVYTAKIVKRSQEEIAKDNEDAEKRRDQKKKNPGNPQAKQNQESFLTVFQVPQLYIETMRRRAANSLALFIKSIPMSKSYFPLSRFKASANTSGQNQDFSRVKKIQLRDFQAKYSEFCVTFGYQPKILEDEEDLFQYYGLKYQKIDDKSTRIFTFLRWKDEKERKPKQSKQDQKPLETSSVKAFLNDMCVKSNFNRDYLLMTELFFAYDDYCNNYGYFGVNKETIEGSKELSDFGAKLELRALPYILNVCQPMGVVSDQVYDNMDAVFNSGFVRIDCRQEEAQLSKFKKCKNCLGKAKTSLCAFKMPFPNCMIVILHIITILLIGLPLLFLISWAVVENSFLVSQPNIPSYTFLDILMPNSLSPWWQTTHSGGLILAFVLVFLVYYILALLDLTSYYATFFSFTGSIRIEKTCSRKVLFGSFYVFFIILVAIYVAYISCVALWMVLGAIINPNKFLPFATSVLTFAFFIYTKYKAMNDLITNLEARLQEFIEEELKDLIQQTMKSVFGSSDGADAITQGLVEGELDKPAKILFAKAIIAFLGDGIKITPEQQEALSNGDTAVLATVVSQGIGVHPAIVKAVLGLVLSQKDLLMIAIQELAKEIGLDSEIAGSFAQIALDSSSNTQGKILLAIKKLFRKVFPVFPPKLIDIVFQLVAEKDPSPFAALIKSNNKDSPDKLPDPKVAIIEVISQFMKNSFGNFNTAMKAMIADLVPNEIRQLYFQLTCVQRGRINRKQPRNAMLDFARDLNFKLRTAIFAFVAYKKNDLVYARVAIDQLIDEVYGKLTQEEKNLKKKNETQKNFLALFALTHGRQISSEAMNELLTYYKYDRSRLTALVGFVKGESAGVATVCDALGITGAKEPIMEIYQLIHERKSYLKELTSKIGLEPKQYEIIKATIDFLSGVAELAVFMRDNSNSSANDFYFSELHDFQKTHYLESISRRLSEVYETFYRFNVLPLEPFSPGSASFLGIHDSLVLHDLEAVFHRLGNDNPDNKNVNVKARLYKIFSENQETIIGEMSGYLKKYLEIEHFNALRAIALIIFSKRVERIPLDEESLKSPFTFRAVKKRPEWSQEHVRWLSEFLQIDIPALNLVVDLISGNPFLIFTTTLASMPAAKYFINCTIFDDERASLLMTLLNCEKSHLRLIAGAWVRQFALINRGWTSIGRVGKKLQMPTAFINVLRNSNSHSSLNGLYDEYQFKKGVYRLIQLLLKEPPKVKQSQHAASPLSQNPQRLQNFKQIIKLIVSIRQGDENTYKDVLGFDTDLSETLSFFFEYIHNPTEAALVDLLLKLQDAASDFSVKLGQAEEDKEADELEGKLIYLHLMLIVLGTQFETKAGAAQDSMSKNVAYLLNEVSGLTKKYVTLRRNKKEDAVTYREGQALPSSSLFYNMLEFNIYNLIVKRMFSRMGLQVKGDDLDTLLGAVIGAGTYNKELYSNCVLELMQKSKYQSVMFSALISVAMQDASKPKEIKQFAKIIGLKSSAAAALMDLQGSNGGQLNQAVSNLAQWEIGKEKCEIIASLISVIKGQVDNVAPLAESIGFKASQLRSLLVAMNGLLEDIESFTPDLCQMLSIQNPTIIQNLLYIAHGNCSHLDELARTHSKHFQLTRPYVADALTVIAKFGRAMEFGRTQRINTGDVSWAVGVLMNQLSWAIGYRRGERDMHDEDQPREERKSEEVNLLDVSINNPGQEEIDQEQEVSELKGEEIVQSFTKDIQLIIKAVWGDRQALELLAHQIMASSSQEIWREFPSKRILILQTALRRAKINLEKLVMARDFSLFKNRQKATKNMERVDQADNEPDAKEVGKLKGFMKNAYQKASTLRERIAIFHKCSFNGALYTPGNQTYWRCNTCCGQDAKEFGICESCASVCHKGHDLDKMNRGRPAKIICQCGNGEIAGVEENQLNSQHQWKELMSENETHFCFFNKKEFRDDYQFKAKVKDKIKSYTYEAGGGVSLSNDTGVPILEDDTDVVEAVYSKYSHELFIADLDASLSKFYKINRTRIPLNMFKKFYDEELETEFSFWEFFIFLAYGYTRISFLPRLTSNEAISPSDLSVASLYACDSRSPHELEFRSLASIVAFSSGDYFNFYRFGLSLAEMVGLSRAKSSSSLKRAEQVMFLVNGPPHQFYFSNTDKIQPNLESYEYVAFFKHIGGSSNIYTKLLGLHLFVKLKRTNLFHFSLILQGDIDATPISCVHETMYYQVYSKLIAGNLLQKAFGIDRKEPSFSWLLSLIQISIGHEPAFDIISSDVIENNSSLTRLYKAFIKPDVYYLKPLLRILQREVSISAKMTESVVRAITENDTDSLVKFLIDHYLRQKLGYGDELVLSKVERFIRSIHQILLGVNSRLEINIREAVQLVQGTQAKANVLGALKGAVNFSTYELRLLFKNDSNSADLVEMGHSILDVAMGTWDYEDINEILEFIKSKARQRMPQLCENGEISPAEFNFILKILKALAGDLTAFGEVSDHLIYQNQEIKCQLLVSMFTGITGFEQDERDSPEKKQMRTNFRARYLREIDDTFDRLFEMVDLESGIGTAATLQQYKIPSLAFLLVALSEPLANKVFNVPHEFVFEGQSPQLIEEIMEMPTSAGVPSFHDIIDQFQKKTPIKEIQEVKYYDLFLNIKGLDADHYTLAQFYKDIDLEEADLKEALDFQNDPTKETISFCIPKFLKLLFQFRKTRTMESVKLLVGMLAPLYEKNPGFLQILKACYFMVSGQKKNIFEVLPVILKLVIHCLTSTSHSIQVFGANMSEEVLDGIVNWFLGILTLLDKDKPITITQIADMVVRMVEVVDKIASELEKSGNKSGAVKSIGSVADGLIGIISICKGDFSGMERIAKLVGSYDEGKMGNFMKILEKYAKFISNSDSKYKAKREDLYKAISSGDQLSINEMFQMFDKDKNGTLDFQEFCELCKYMGLFLNKEILLQLYAEADENDNNNIDKDEFKVAITVLKNKVGNDALEMMGLTRRQLIQVLLIAGFFLLMLFAFIFMGVSAFSEANGFSAVINSILPAVAGLSMGSGKTDYSKINQQIKILISKIIKAIKSS